MDINYFFDGEIYLKKEPDFFQAEEFLPGFQDAISELKVLLNDANDRQKVEIKNLIKNYEMLASYAKSGDGEVDYSGLDDFWQAFQTSDGISLVTCNEVILEKKYQDIRELDKHFLKLSTFLAKATYIGKKFERLKPTSFDDTSFMKDDIYNCTGLYQGKNMLLAFFENKSNPFDTYYGLIDERFLKDNNYTFKGEVNLDYQDKHKVLRDIYEQVTNKERTK